MKNRNKFEIILSSTVFSLLFSTSLVSAADNPAGTGLGTPNESERIISNDSQSVDTTTNINDSGAGTSQDAIQFAAGFLSLNSVPDLHFENGAGGLSTQLINNSRGGYTGESFSDGNSYGKLQVSDFRYSGEPFSTSTSVPLNGWTLTAKLGFFSPIGGTGVPNPVSSNPEYNDSGSAAYGGTAPTPTEVINTVGNNDWAIFLNNRDAAVNRTVANGVNFRNNVLISNGPMNQYPNNSDVNYSNTATLIAGGPDVKIWWTPQNYINNKYGGFGKTTAYYDSSGTASLKIGAKAKSGHYYAPITWTLMASSS